jgi:hypothetical protein
VFMQGTPGPYATAVNLGAQSIGILPPQPTTQQHHLAPRNVVAKTEISPSEAGAGLLLLQPLAAS